MAAPIARASPTFNQVGLIDVASARQFRKIVRRVVAEAAHRCDESSFCGDETSQIMTYFGPISSFDGSFTEPFVRRADPADRQPERTEERDRVEARFVE
jgi:hypothetical protein